jgi:hypothetical protein
MDRRSLIKRLGVVIAGSALLPSHTIAKDHYFRKKSELAADLIIKNPNCSVYDLASDDSFEVHGVSYSYDINHSKKFDFLDGHDPKKVSIDALVFKHKKGRKDPSLKLFIRGDGFPLESYVDEGLDDFCDELQVRAYDGDNLNKTFSFSLDKRTRKKWQDYANENDNFKLLNFSIANKLYNNRLNDFLYLIKDSGNFFDQFKKDYDYKVFKC